ncbi:MAG: GNAT family N-acetyltransferase [Alphaproteobacteria bacterium]|nr:MAG: GNAT family N-acetyltransferase [Alphaproteobacteria bacterium]
MASLPPPSFIIQTENFMLRPIGREDASLALESWTEDETAVEMLNTKRRQWSIAEQVAYFAKYEGQRTRFLLGLFPHGQNEPVGLFIIKLRAEDDLMLVTHLIGDRQWRGTGASREASIGIFDFFFNKLNFKKAKANVRPSNRSMQWLLLNGGWRREAHLTRHLRERSSGDRADVLVFGILADEWRASRASAKTVRRRNGEPRRGLPGRS